MKFVSVNMLSSVHKCSWEVIQRPIKRGWSTQLAVHLRVQGPRTRCGLAPVRFCTGIDQATAF